MKTLLDIDPMLLAKKVSAILCKKSYVVSCYLFGSALEGKITGASDLDILVVVRGKHPKEAYLELSLELENSLGEWAYLVDLHICDIRNRSDIPYRWFIEKSIVLCEK